jgi:DNA-binding response OmpR family regulator
MKKKILIVEDEEAMSKPLEEALEESGFDVYVASDGESGFKLIKEKKPDLVVLDLIMPKVGGVELLNNIKNDNDIKDMEIIILSNVSTEKGISDILSIGVYDYLVKQDHTLGQIVEKVKAKLA